MVASANWQIVSAVGRLRERNRFKRRDFASSRKTAMTAAGFSESGGQWIPVADSFVGDSFENSGGEWSVDTGFEEVPAKYLHGHLWEPKLARRFHDWSCQSYQCRRGRPLPVGCQRGWQLLAVRHVSKKSEHFAMLCHSRF